MPDTANAQPPEMIVRSFRGAVASPALAVSFATLLVSLYLSPMLFGGWTGGDVYRAQYCALPSWLHVSWLEALRRSSGMGSSAWSVWIFRAAPNAFWLLGPSVAASKLVGFALLIADAMTLFILVALLTRSRAAIVMVAVAFVASLEIRLTGDPLLGASIGTPWSVEWMMLASVTGLLAMERARREYFVIGLVATAGAVLTDPVNGVVAVAFVGFAHAGHGRERWQRLRARALVATALVARAVVAVSARSGSTTTFGRVQHVAAQIAAPIPTLARADGSVVSTTVSFALHDDRFTGIPEVDLVGWIVALAVGIAAYRCTVAGEHRQRHDGVLLWTGGAYWLAAPFFGDTTTVLASCGFALVASAALRAVVDRLSGVDRRITAAVAGFAALWLAYGNLRVMHAAIDATIREDGRRSLLAQTLAAGALDRVSEGSRVALNVRPYPLSFAAGVDGANVFVYRYSGRRIRALDAPAFPRDVTIFAYRRIRSSDEVVTSRVAADGRATEATIFRSFSGASERESAASTIPLQLPGLERTIHFYGSQLFVERVSRRCGAVPLDRIDLPDGPSIRYGAGFYPIDAALRRSFVGAISLPDAGSPDQPWRIAGARAAFEIVPSRCSDRRLKLTFEIQTAAPAAVTMGIGSSSVFFRASEARRRISSTLDVDARRVIRVELATNGPPATEEAFLPRTDVGGREDQRMLVLHPQAQPADALP